MKIIGYRFDLFNQFVDITLNNGELARVSFNLNTGLIYSRNKKDSILSNVIQHKGLYVGTWGNKHIIIHNHIDAGSAEVVTFEEFANELEVFIDDKDCSNKPTERVQIALDDVLLNKPYDLLENNCQTLANKACSNVSKSDDGFKVLLITLFATLLLVIIAAIIGTYSNRLART